MSGHRTPALAFPPSRWAGSSPRGITGTHWMLKGRRTMARLSHSPSNANLLAQYTALKGSPGAEPHPEHQSCSPQGAPCAAGRWGSHLAAPRCCWRQRSARPCGSSWQAGRPGWCGQPQGRSHRREFSWPARSRSPAVPSVPPLHCRLPGTLQSACDCSPTHHQEGRNWGGAFSADDPLAPPNPSTAPLSC